MKFITLSKNFFTTFDKISKLRLGNAVGDCFLIITGVQNKKSKKQPFRIYFYVKLADGRMSMKKGKKISSYLIYQIASKNGWKNRSSFMKDMLNINLKSNN